MGRKGVIGMLFGLMMKITLLYTDILPRWGKWCGLSPFFNKNSVLDGTGFLHRSNIFVQNRRLIQPPAPLGAVCCFGRQPSLFLRLISWDGKAYSLAGANHESALVLVKSMPAQQAGGKEGVWFLLPTYRPDGTRGKEAGMVFFGKHGGPPGRGLLQRSSTFVQNLELDEACAP